MIFKFWTDEQAGYVTPILSTTFSAAGWMPILASGNGGWGRAWGPALAAAEISLGKGTIRLCQVDLAGREVESHCENFCPPSACDGLIQSIRPNNWR